MLRERDRWVLWTPVGFGIGIGAYFGLPVEPGVWIGPALPGCLVAGLIILKVRGGAIWPLILMLVLVAGFSAAQIRTALVPEHMLQRPVAGMLTGTVEAVEERPSRPRMILGEGRLETARGSETFSKVRISLPPGRQMPSIGSAVKVRVSLRPPPAPSTPDAYDFQRAAFFKELSAVGYGIGSITSLAATSSNAGVENVERFSLPLWLARYRFDLSRRITEALPGPSGALASALLTGERGPLPEEVLRVMRESGLAHLLAISGLHMGLVAGIVFVGLRGVLALSRRLALGYPIKKWAALGAFIFAAGYLLLSGASVPTQRAFLMTGLVLIAVLLDREAISMRLVAWAAMVALVLRPEALLSASFQLSFAAVTALVATYEVVAARRRSRPGWSGGWQGRVMLYLGALVLTSIVANLATMPFGAYHFNRVATHGLASNLVAVPLAGFWIMPWGVLALALAPFGLEGIALKPMGWGLDILVLIATEVSAWPSAVIPVAAWPAYVPSVIAVGGAWLCLWRKPWRGLGAAVIVAVVVLALVTPGPRVWIAGDGRLAAIRADDGRVVISTKTRNRFTADLWMRRAGGTAKSAWRDEPELIKCDDLGCVTWLDGAMIAFSDSGRGLLEDCRRARIVVTQSFVPHCEGPEQVFDHHGLWRSGGLAIWIDDGDIHTRSTAETRGDRPWTLNFHN